MDAVRAGQDLDLIEEVIARTRLRVDPHAFHFVHWGAIVLVWYPLANWFQSRGNLVGVAVVGVGALLLGTLLSGLRERSRQVRARLPGEDQRLGRRVGLVVAANCGVGMLLSILGPSTGFIEGPDVPIVWGLVYANMAFITGLIYTRDFGVAAAAILAGVVIAILLRPWCGYVLGPFMGLGMIVPGLRAEARVRRLREAEVADAGEV